MTPVVTIGLSLETEKSTLNLANLLQMVCFFYNVESFEVLPGDVLGVYQSSTSNSPVRLFYTNLLPRPPRTLTIDTLYSDTYHVNPTGLEDFNGTILVRPVSG